MSKAAKLAVESAARAAIGRQCNCVPVRGNLAFPNGGASHEFDIYVHGVLIGGVSTSPLKVGAGNINTGGCDRASSEVLWFSNGRYRSRCWPYYREVQETPIEPTKLKEVPPTLAPVNEHRKGRTKP